MGRLLSEFDYYTLYIQVALLNDELIRAHGTPASEAAQASGGERGGSR